MSDNKITALLGQAIREGKYLNITYKNQDDEINPFWICILDINANDELKVNMFNVTKDDPLKERKIFISRIQTAEILKFSHYDVPDRLIKKIEEDESLEKYDFDRFDNNVLNYYLECYKANTDPFLHKKHLIPDLDIHELENQNPYPLTDKQQKHIIKEIYRNDYNTFYGYELAICEFSIDLESKGKFVVAYRKLLFDPVGKTLIIGSTTNFNSNFYINDTKYSLSYYTDLSPIDFESSYREDTNGIIKQLSDNFRSGELANTRPEVVVLGYKQFNISDIYDEINSEHSKNEMQIPLKAFFQNLSLFDRKN
jgi:hypothetical protein